MSYIKKRKRREFIKSELLIFCLWIKTFWKFFLTVESAPPASCKKIELPPRHRQNQHGVKTAYQIQAVAKHPQLLEAGWTELGGGWMGGQKSRCPPKADFTRNITLEEKLGRSSLAQYQVARSVTNLLQGCFWSWKNTRFAERREHKDARPERHL